MKHKTWFRLVLKALGILVIATKAPDAIGLAWAMIVDLANSGGMMWSWDSWFAGHLISTTIGIGIGLYLLLRGEWLVNFVIPSNRRYCPDCGYDVSESPLARRCSECGATLPTDDGANATAPAQSRTGADE